MPLDKNDPRYQQGLARARARKFASLVKRENLAVALPDDWAAYTSEEIRLIQSFLPEFGLRQRSDFLWEEARYV